MTSKTSNTNQTVDAYSEAAKAAIEGLQDSSVSLAKYFTTHEAELNDVQKKNISDAIGGLTVQIMALNGVLKDEEMEDAMKVELIDNAQKSIATALHYLSVSGT